MADIDGVTPAPNADAARGGASVEKVTTVAQPPARPAPAQPAHQWPPLATDPGYAGTPIRPTPDPIAERQPLPPKEA